MAVTMFTRFTIIRNVMNVNNISAVGGALSVKQHSDVTSKHYTTTVATEMEKLVISEGQKPVKKLSKAMKMYLEKSKEYYALIEKETARYEIGKRHLANMMGEDPDQFNESDIKRAIRYLLPSGIYDRRARPIMCHPTTLFGNRKEAQFDETGRPHHWLFYTCKPQYNQILYNVAEFLKNLNEKQDQMIKQNKLPSAEDKFNALGSTWITPEELEKKLLEELTTREYEYFTKSMDRLVEHPLSAQISEFIMKYRKVLQSSTQNLKLPELRYDSNDRPFVVIKSCKRKTAVANVKVTGQGSGMITINGKDISYFPLVQDREQILFPLIFTNLTGKVDIEATVSGGGPTGQSGAIRVGIAYGLRNFVDVEMIEKMRIAGLLTKDPRTRERKKFGQEGARRKFTWKKR